MAQAVARSPRPPVVVFVWPLYLNGSTMLSAEDLRASIELPYHGCADGLVIWGSGQQVNSSAFWRYAQEQLGPMLHEVRSKPRPHCV